MVQMLINCGTMMTRSAEYAAKLPNIVPEPYRATPYSNSINPERRIIITDPRTRKFSDI